VWKYTGIIGYRLSDTATSLLSSKHNRCKASDDDDDDDDDHSKWELGKNALFKFSHTPVYFILYIYTWKHRNVATKLNVSNSSASHL
jgi:hypothetical protein